MNHFAKTMIIAGLAGVLCPGATAEPEPQPQVAFSGSAGGVWSGVYEGVAGRTYFMLGSQDLVNWEYLPDIKFGVGTHTSSGTNTNVPKYFFRLKYTDVEWVTSLQEARDADFDNDGIPSWFEVETLFTDPFDKASDGGDANSNGMSDGYELFHFGALGASGPGADYDGDGLLNLVEALLGMNAAAGFVEDTSTNWEIHLPN